MVPPISHKVPRVSWYSGSCRCLPLSSTRLSLSLAGFPKTILLAFSSLVQSMTPRCTHHGLGSFPFARRYSGNRCFFLFLRLLRCFSSPGSLSYTMYLCKSDTITRTGFPHSDIHGSKPAYGSPWLFAVNHVLLRLLVPRHSPCALISLIVLSESLILRSNLL